jgi:nucleotide-binding universal stress UspA family protein
MSTSINKILLPTDYSVNAVRASRFGMALAKKLEAKVVLFHSYHFLLADSTDLNYVNEMKEVEESKLNEEKETLQTLYPDVDIVCEVDYGPVVNNVEMVVDRLGIDLVIMGTKGETNQLDAVLGSVASNVINSVKCSTLIIPEETHEFKLDQIMLATDFHQSNSDEIFDSLKSVLRKTDASLAIVNVKSEMEEIDTVSKEEIGNIFGEFKHSHHYIEGDNVEETLFDFANVNYCDMIVILTKHYSLWQRLFHKSMAKQLALHSSIPLFIIHEDA